MVKHIEQGDVGMQIQCSRSRVDKQVECISWSTLQLAISVDVLGHPKRHTRIAEARICSRTWDPTPWTELGGHGLMSVDAAQGSNRKRLALGATRGDLGVLVARQTRPGRLKRFPRPFSRAPFFAALERKRKPARPSLGARLFRLCVKT